MSKTNKELAVELYGAFLQSAAIFNSNSKETMKMPDIPEMLETIYELQKGLSRLPD